MNNLKAVDTHFAFGENWSEYAKHIDQTKIDEAEKGLLKLITKEELVGKTFLDIGCGSGLHALAALRLGAAQVLATDIDAISVATTKHVLATYAPVGANYTVREVSVFDLSKELTEQFDVVYSWGVLHHTGDMYGAITEATKLVRSQGLFAVALYRQTLLCGIWKRIKNWYTHTSEANQKKAQRIYISLFKLRHILARKDFEAMRQNYHSARGMSFEYDVHDWLGGYPYESITPEATKEFMATYNFALHRSFISNSGIGFFGSGCDEFVFKKLGN